MDRRRCLSMGTRSKHEQYQPIGVIIRDKLWTFVSQAIFRPFSMGRCTIVFYACFRWCADGLVNPTTKRRGHFRAQRLVQVWSLNMPVWSAWKEDVERGPLTTTLEAVLEDHERPRRGGRRTALYNEHPIPLQRSARIVLLVSLVCRWQEEVRPW